MKSLKDKLVTESSNYIMNFFDNIVNKAEEIDDEFKSRFTSILAKIEQTIEDDESRKYLDEVKSKYAKYIVKK